MPKALRTRMMLSGARLFLNSIARCQSRRDFDCRLAEEASAHAAVLVRHAIGYIPARPECSSACEAPLVSLCSAMNPTKLIAMPLVIPSMQAIPLIGAKLRERISSFPIHIHAPTQVNRDSRFLPFKALFEMEASCTVVKADSVKKVEVCGGCLKEVRQYLLNLRKPD
ncbi:hypothetical protein ACTXT7_014541 [Hymenolepis weldensis]